MKIPFCSTISNVSKRLGALKVVVQVAKIEPITLQGFENDLLEIIGSRTDPDGPVALAKVATPAGSRGRRTGLGFDARRPGIQPARQGLRSH